jgi:hypothetical protein
MSDKITLELHYISIRSKKMYFDFVGEPSQMVSFLTTQNIKYRIVQKCDEAKRLTDLHYLEIWLNKEVKAKTSALTISTRLVAEGFQIKNTRTERDKNWEFIENLSTI